MISALKSQEEANIMKKKTKKSCSYHKIRIFGFYYLKVCS